MVNPEMARALLQVLILPVRPGARVLAIALIHHGLQAHRCHDVWAARSVLTRQTGLSKDGLDGAMRELVAVGLVTVLNRGKFDRVKGKRQTHRYDLRPLFRRFGGLLQPSRKELQP